MAALFLVVSKLAASIELATHVTKKCISKGVVEVGHAETLSHSAEPIGRKLTDFCDNLRATSPAPPADRVLERSGVVSVRYQRGVGREIGEVSALGFLKSVHGLLLIAGSTLDCCDIGPPPQFQECADGREVTPFFSKYAACLPVEGKRCARI